MDTFEYFLADLIRKEWEADHFNTTKTHDIAEAHRYLCSVEGLDAGLPFTGAAYEAALMFEPVPGMTLREFSDYLDKWRTTYTESADWAQVDEWTDDIYRLLDLADQHKDEP